MTYEASILGLLTENCIKVHCWLERKRMFSDETEMERCDQHPLPFPTDHTTHLPQKLQYNKEQTSFGVFYVILHVFMNSLWILK